MKVNKEQYITGRRKIFKALGLGCLCYFGQRFSLSNNKPENDTKSQEEFLLVDGWILRKRDLT